MSSAPKKSSKKPLARAAEVGAGLPAALAKNARAMRAAKLERLAVVGRAAIARIRERQADIAANMVEIGEALAELKADGVAEALERKGFAEICALDVRIPYTTALNLVALATRVPREVVVNLGPERARALLELVDATPADDSPEEVLARPLALPSGRVLDARNAGVVELRAAAKEFRAARPEATQKRSRGFTATPEEKRTFATLQKKLREREADVAVKLIATRDPRGAKIQLELRLADLGTLPMLLRLALK